MRYEREHNAHLLELRERHQLNKIRFLIVFVVFAFGVTAYNAITVSSDAAYKSCVEAGVQSNQTCKFYAYR